MHAEFEVGGRKYRAGRMDAMTQFHVARRLARILPALKGLAAVMPALLKEEADQDSGVDLDTMAGALAPVVDAIAGMSDADSEYVLGNCLSVVQRQDSSGGWAAIWSVQAKRPMFDDLSMPEMVQISVRVLMGALGPF